MDRADRRYVCGKHVQIPFATWILTLTLILAFPHQITLKESVKIHVLLTDIVLNGEKLLTFRIVEFR